MAALPGEPVSEQWSVLLPCLASSVRVASKVPGPTALRVAVGEVRQIVQRSLRDLNQLHQDMGLTELQRRQTFDRSMSAIQAVMA